MAGVPLRPKVIVHRSDALAYSETFIKEQMLACQRWHPVLVGTRHIESGLPLDGLHAQFLRAGHRGLGVRAADRLARFLGLPAPGSVPQLRAIGARLVHVHFATDAVDLWPSLERLGLPVLVTLHGFDIHTHRQWWEAGHGGSHARRYPTQLLAMAKSPLVQFIAVSDAVREAALRYGIAADKVVVHYIGVDTQRFVPAGVPVGERAPRVLYIGRMVEKKGGHHLIQAVAALRAQVPQVQLVMIGDGPLLAQHRALAETLGLYVQFMGRQPPDVVRAEIARARVFCLPSVTAENGDAEGLPIVMLEAQACGVPTVTSARGGATEGIIEAQTGFAFAEGDVAALAPALSRLLVDDALANRMSLQARALMEQRFDLRLCTAGLESAYDIWSQSANAASGVALPAR